MVEPTELAWCAGFFDGEGCFTTQGGSTQMVANVAQSGSSETLERFRRVVGLGRIYGPYTTERGKPRYHWRACGNKSVQAVFQMLKPYLSRPKRVQFYEVAEKVGIHAKEDPQGEATTEGIVDEGNLAICS